MFHVSPDGETTTGVPQQNLQPEQEAFAKGLLMGLLVGEGHFGGDGRQPHVTLRMHVRHAQLFRWLCQAVPGSRLYGPYHHAGRDYYQWMVRGEALRRYLLPLIESVPLAELDPPTWERYLAMKRRYRLDALRAGGEARAAERDG